MGCEKVIKELSAYLDGQMSAAEMAAVRTHLKGCARCRAELESLDRTAYDVADLPRIQAPAELRDQVMAKLEGVTPKEAFYPRWRLYWGVAATIAIAAVIMLLTKSATPSRPALEASTPAAKKVSDREVAQIPRPASAQAEAGKVAEKSLQDAAAPVSSERIVVMSADPEASYCNAVAVAAKGGWLPAVLQKPGEADKLLKAADLKRDAHQVPQLTLRVKRNQLPLLKSALVEAGLNAVLVPHEQPEEAQPAAAGTPQLAYARPRVEMDAAARSATNAAPAESRFGVEARSMKAITAAVPAAAPAEAAKAPQALGGAAATGPRQTVVEQGSQQAETTPVTAQEPAGVAVQHIAEREAPRAATTAADELRKSGADDESLVRVTLLFPFAGVPVPAPAVAPTAGATTSVTPE